jgi:uncharacterized RDD family membrane protein YckC
MEVIMNDSTENEKEPKNPEIIPHATGLKKADPIKRVIAFIIDVIASMIIGLIPVVGGIIGALYMLFRDALPIDVLEKKSIGNKLLNLSVIKIEDETPVIDYATSAKRNWMFSLGPVMLFFIYIPILGWLIDIILAIVLFVLIVIELLKIFLDEKGIRLGDKWAGTMVIED